MSRIRLEGDCWVDENNNKWNAYVWTYGLACKLSESLIHCENCYNCIECFNCEHCKECQNCRDCSSCYFCYLCMNCEACVGSDYSFFCKYCTFVSSCMKCLDCENLIGLALRNYESNLASYSVDGERSDLEIVDDYVASFVIGYYEKYSKLYIDENGDHLIIDPKRKRVLSEIDGYYVDQFNNKWDKNMFTKQQVDILTLGLAGCYDCVNCIGGYFQENIQMM